MQQPCNPRHSGKRRCSAAVVAGVSMTTRRARCSAGRCGASVATVTVAAVAVTRRRSGCGLLQRGPIAVSHEISARPISGVAADISGARCPSWVGGITGHRLRRLRIDETVLRSRFAALLQTRGSPHGEKDRCVRRGAGRISRAAAARQAPDILHVCSEHSWSAWRELHRQNGDFARVPGQQTGCAIASSGLGSDLHACNEAVERPECRRSIMADKQVELVAISVTCAP